MDRGKKGQAFTMKWIVTTVDNIYPVLATGIGCPTCPDVYRIWIPRDTTVGIFDFLFQGFHGRVKTVGTIASGHNQSRKTPVLGQYSEKNLGLPKKT